MDKSIVIPDDKKVTSQFFVHTMDFDLKFLMSIDQFDGKLSITDADSLLNEPV